MQKYVVFVPKSTKKKNVQKYSFSPTIILFCLKTDKIDAWTSESVKQVGMREASAWAFSGYSENIPKNVKHNTICAFLDICDILEQIAKEIETIWRVIAKHRCRRTCMARLCGTALTCGIVELLCTLSKNQQSCFLAEKSALLVFRPSSWALQWGNGEFLTHQDVCGKGVYRKAAYVAGGNMWQGRNVQFPRKHLTKGAWAFFRRLCRTAVLFTTACTSPDSTYLGMANELIFFQAEVVLGFWRRKKATFVGCAIERWCVQPEWRPHPLDSLCTLHSSQKKS